jgi:hypothetical protein
MVHIAHFSITAVPPIGGRTRFSERRAEMDPCVPGPGPGPGLSFDLSNIVQGPSVHASKEVCYTAYACTAASIDQATDIVDYIAQRYYSEDCMPYAIRLVEAGELISIAQDNGDFLCGAVVANALKRLDGYNALICVTRQVKGVFVTDMIHTQVRGAVKIAAEKAADALLQVLRANQSS